MRATLHLGVLALALSLAAPAARELPRTERADVTADTVAAPRPCTAIAVTTLPDRIAPSEAQLDSAHAASHCRRVSWVRRGFIVPVTAADSAEDARLEPRITWDSLAPAPRAEKPRPLNPLAP